MLKTPWVAVALASFAVGCFDPAPMGGSSDATAPFDAAASGPDAQALIADAAEPPDAGAPGLDASLPDAGNDLCAGGDGAPLPKGTVCRASAGECDSEETCDGVSSSCPADRLAPKATFCGDVSWCSGASALCPPGSGEWKVAPDDRWYWSNPLPQGHWLFGVWASAGDDVWAVGLGGTILHWDGRRWAQVESGTRMALRGVWGSSAHDVWAVGMKGTLLHWDGVVWSPWPSPASEELVSIWGSGPEDVWVVTYGGPVLHFDGTGWVQVSGISDHDGPIHGSDKDDAWIGATLHWDGTQWQPRASPHRGATDVFSADPSHAWACSPPFLQRWDGAQWNDVTGLDPHFECMGLWGASATDVWALGHEWVDDGMAIHDKPGSVVFHWDGASWTRVETGLEPNLWDVWGAGSEDVWAVGEGGGMIHWDGRTWTGASRGTNAYFHQIWGSGPSDVWVGGKYESATSGTGPFDRFPLLHWDGARWSQSSIGQEGYPLSISGSGPDDVWVVGRPLDGSKGPVLHRWNGVAWSSEPFAYQEVLVTGKTDAWSYMPYGGYPYQTVEHWDGTAWSVSLTTPNTDIFTDMFASDPSNLFVTTWGGAVEHWDGSAWSAMPDLPASGAYGVSAWTWGPDGAWVVRNRPGCAFVRWDGLTWTCHPGPHDSLANEWSRAVWGNAGEAWAVDSSADSSQCLDHWDGQAWQHTGAWNGTRLDALWGPSASDVWAVGEYGAILHRK